MVRLSLNGTEVEFAGGTLLQALRAAGIEVPTLCHDDRIKPYGGCRLCVVEDLASGKLVPACTTHAVEGMRVQTHSDRVENLRRTNLGLLAAAYPADSKLDEKLEFHRLLIQYGISPSGRPDESAFRDDSHPYLKVDMSLCIHCNRCVRICDEVQGQHAWRLWNRGDRTQIRPDRGDSLIDSSCVSCGACSDTCPAGAIADRARVDSEPDSWTRTTCPYCGTGCELEIGVRKGQVLVGRPVQHAVVNRGHLCVKGRYAHAFVHAPDRVTTPLIRRGGEWQPATWDEALDAAASGLRQILDTGGPSAVGVLGSARATNEENYLAQKFARVVLGTNNVDCCARVCHGPTAAALKQSFGTGAATNSFEDIEVSAGFLICGANPTENHPVVGARIKQAVLAGASLVVIDPRRIELAGLADIHVQIRPGTNIPALHALAHVIVAEGLADTAFASARTDNFAEYQAFLAEWTPERAGPICGVDPEELRRAARVYAGAKPAMIFHGLGMTEHTQGSEGVRCLANLALLTGNIGIPGSGENPLRGQNNVQGSAHMGCEPSNLAGYTPIAQAAEFVEQVWGRPVPRDQGLNWMQMVDAGSEGKLRGLWCIGWDVLFSNPDAAATEKSLSALDLLIVQDLFINETARRFGHIFFPACSSYEKDGTFMNSERRIQRIRRAIPPIGDSKPDWEIVCALAARLGHRDSFAFTSPKEVWEEVRKVWKAGAGISYDRIEERGVQWPCPSEDHPGTSILHRDAFPLGDRAPFALVDYVPTEEVVSAEFPFLLNTGRSLYQFNAGTMSLRTPNTEFRKTDTLDVAPADAARLGLGEGEPVLLVSRYGQTTIPVHIDDRIRLGECFATFHDPKVFVNRVTSSRRDRVVGAGEYKVTAVRIERIPERAG